MPTYRFWNTDCGLGIVSLDDLSDLAPSVTAIELARYIATDWQPFGLTSQTARDTVHRFLELIVEDSEGDWVMKKEEAQLTRGWKGMISEAIGIAFSRHSASAIRGYDFCAHLDHFLPNGFLEIPNLIIRKRYRNRLRPDYLLAARRFMPHSADGVRRNVVGSMEVKGKADPIMCEVPDGQRKQSKNVLLYDGDFVPPSNIRINQKLLSMVRANRSAIGEETRTVAVRHSNSLEPSEEHDSPFFAKTVIAHYMRIIDQITEQKLRDEISTFFQTFCTNGEPEICDASGKASAGDSILKHLNSVSKTLKHQSLISISSELNDFFESLFSGHLQKELYDAQSLDPLDRELKTLEQASKNFKENEKDHLGKDGFVFHLR